MARDYIDIGSSPAEEDCASVGEEDYTRKARTECARFIELIRKTLGPEPEGAHLAVKSNPHDFGSYLEVVCYFQDDDEEARKYAFRCESDAPATWDAQPKPPSRITGERLQCSNCNLITIARDYSARDVFCNCCGRKLWRATAADAQTEPAQPARRSGVCDSCLEVAAGDYGIPDRPSQEMLMVEMGTDLADHLCDGVEAPDIGTKCACACRRR